MGGCFSSLLFFSFLFFSFLFFSFLLLQGCVPVLFLYRVLGSFPLRHIFLFSSFGRVHYSLRFQLGFLSGFRLGILGFVLLFSRVYNFLYIFLFTLLLNTCRLVGVFLEFSHCMIGYSLLWFPNLRLAFLTLTPR
ncbi:hypothetical protein DFP73DRAFT_44396 [Morchella snyderi]|nr:hypothetical protein DFP73DRAFT_44396 [Morchella snyderi]